MFKYIFKGNDILLRDVISFLGENGFEEASEFLSENAVSIDTYNKIIEEKQMEKESLEEEDFTPEEQTDLENVITFFYALLVNNKNEDL